MTLKAKVVIRALKENEKAFFNEYKISYMMPLFFALASMFLAAYVVYLIYFGCTSGFFQKHVPYLKSIEFCSEKKQ